MPRFLGERGPLVTLDDAPRRVVRTSREDPGDGAAPRLECGDGPLWVLEHEPA